MNDKERGLYSKYVVNRIDDPTRKHAGCEYFVLDIDHDPYAIPALQAYAVACRNKYPVLAADIEKLVGSQTNGEIERLQADLAAALKRAEAAEAERDATKAILSDPEAVHTNIMLGRITLPDYYVRTTDTNGPFAMLTAERDAALKRAETAERELYVLRVSNKHGEHDDRCPRCEAERHWKEGAK